MSWTAIVKRLEEGEILTLKACGGSMSPIIQNREEYELRPIGDLVPVTGDIVLAKVHGMYYVHKVTATDEAKDRVQISNNSGHVNGWTSRDKVYGIVSSHHAGNKREF